MFSRLATLCAAGVVLTLLASNGTSAQNLKLLWCDGERSEPRMFFEYENILGWYRAANAASLPKSAPEAEFVLAAERARHLDRYVREYEKRTRAARDGLDAAIRLALESPQERDFAVSALDEDDAHTLGELSRKMQSRTKVNRDRLERLQSRVFELHAALCRAQAQRSSPSAGGGAVLMMDGEPKPQPKFGGFTVVEDGKVQLDDPAFVVVGTWDKLPRSFDGKGHSIMLALNARGITGPLNTGIQIRVTGLEMEVTKSKGTPAKSRDNAQYDLPLTVEKGKAGDAHMVILLKPKASYAKGETVTISVGTFWGRKVDYVYRAQ